MTKYMKGAEKAKKRDDKKDEEEPDKRPANILVIGRDRYNSCHHK